MSGFVSEADRIDRLERWVIRIKRQVNLLTNQAIEDEKAIGELTEAIRVATGQAQANYQELRGMVARLIDRAGPTPPLG